MYLGYKSIHALRSWLDGYWYAKQEAGIPYTADEERFAGLHDFVSKKYSWHDTGAWNLKIAHFHGDEASAFDEFFRILQEFRTLQECL
jgi:hypothetical protein